MNGELLLDDMYKSVLLKLVGRNGVSIVVEENDIIFEITESEDSEILIICLVMILLFLMDYLPNDVIKPGPDT